MHKCNAAYPHRGDGDIRRLIAHGNRKGVIHEIPEVGRRALRKFEYQLVGQFAVDDGVVVVEAYVMKPKIDVSQEPGEDYREQRRRHVQIDLPTRPAGRMVEHRRHPDEAGYRESIDDYQHEPVVWLPAA